jgi:DNA repair protein RadD
LLRPTNSAGLFVQQVGRGLRNSLGKENCLVLDFAGLVKKHGPIDMVSVNGARKAKGEAEEIVRAKECPVCATLVALNTRQCPTCAHQWPIPDAPPKHEATADAVSAIVSKGAPAWIAVDSTRFYVHRKDGSPDSLRVEYSCGFTVHKEWLGFQHQGLMRQKAERFWAQAAQQPIPRTTAEALARQREIRQPTAIMVRPEGKYFAVVGRRFSEPEQMGEAAE